MDPKEFFKLLNAEADQHSRELDEFDLEALEGLKMVKDPVQAKTTADANIDKKLAELVEEEKKDRAGLYLSSGDAEKERPKTGLYIMSVAASLVLLLGVFFVFKNVNKSDEAGVADVSLNNKSAAAYEETTAAAAPPAEPARMDSMTAQNQEPVKVPAVTAPAIQLETKASGAINVEGYFKKETETIELAEADAKVEPKKAQDDRTVWKSDNRSEDQKVVLESKNVNQQEQVQLYTNKGVLDKETVVAADKFTIKDKDVKKRSVLKGKERAKSEAAADDYAAGVPPMMDEQKPMPAYVADSTSVAVTATGSATTISQNTATTLSATSPGATTFTWSTTKDASVKADAAPVIAAEFKGGKAALEAYIKKNLVVPASWISEEVIIVKFTVDAKGQISKPKITSKTGNCKDCETEAIRFVKAMPAWVAATQDGKAVASQKTIVLSFKK